MIYVDLLASNYSYSIEYIEEMPAFTFLKLIRCIQKREAEHTLMQSHVVCMANANEEAWNDFKASLGFAPVLSDLARAAKGELITDSRKLSELKSLTREQ